MSDELFFTESGTLNLRTGKVTDDNTGRESCLVDWTEDIARRKTAQLRKLVARRDIASDLVNLPGTKPYFDADSGLIAEGPERRGECGSNYYSGLSGL